MMGEGNSLRTLIIQVNRNKFKAKGEDEVKAGHLKDGMYKRERSSREGKITVCISVTAGRVLILASAMTLTNWYKETLST